MFIILSIYSKNVNSLTNFLKFFYKLKLNKVLKLKFHIIQSQKKNLFSFFSTLQSPHVNKKSQEQFVKKCLFDSGFWTSFLTRPPLA